MEIREHDAMVCRACGNEDRASEGYPCVDCGTFLCLLCDLRGVQRCKACEAKRLAGEKQPAKPVQ
jgi:DNA-directed RNA polymerase subunit RPC12/RpoP